MRGGRFDAELNLITVLWLEGALVRKIGLQMASFRLSGLGCYRSTTVDLRSIIPIDGAEILKDKCLYIEK